jgi:hypothetical protein
VPPPEPSLRWLWIPSNRSNFWFRGRSQARRSNESRVESGTPSTLIPISTHDMDTNHITLAPQALITTSPTPAALLVDRQASSKKYDYPACRNDPNGPCALSDRAKELCTREFATWSNGGYPRQYYCQCTNGYYTRSSEYVASSSQEHILKF